MDESPALLVLEREPRELTRDYALRCLEYNITNLYLKPGQFISEQSVWNSLTKQDSHSGSLSKLANEMLVVIYPQIGQCCPN